MITPLSAIVAAIALGLYSMTQLLGEAHRKNNYPYTSKATAARRIMWAIGAPLVATLVICSVTLG